MQKENQKSPFKKLSYSSLIRTSTDLSQPIPISQQFEISKTRSCRKVVSRAGQVIAIPYKTAFYLNLPDTQSSPFSKLEAISTKSPIPKVSTNQETFKFRKTLYAGMGKKPLEPYSPNAFRSRIGTPDFKFTEKNKSQFEIGSNIKEGRKYMTTYKAHISSQNNLDFTGNLGIMSERTKWIHQRMNL